MDLNYKKLGTGQAFVILHGLFGSLDNWQTIGKKLSEDFTVYLVDQRNHGQSPHSETWNYEAMAEDIHGLFKKENISDAILLGHSMGGKTAMKFASEHPKLLKKLIVADIAPRYYELRHDFVIDALESVDLNKVSSRKEVEDVLSQHISDFATKQFLLKNLYWKDLDNKSLAWRFNLKIISKNIENVGTAIKPASPVKVPALFIRGAKSNYIQEEDSIEIKTLFPDYEIKTIENAGHWLHAEAPEEFYRIIHEFALK
jgi:esterase